MASAPPCSGKTSFMDELIPAAYLWTHFLKLCFLLQKNRNELRNVSNEVQSPESSCLLLFSCGAEVREQFLTQPPDGSVHLVLPPQLPELPGRTLLSRQIFLLTNETNKHLNLIRDQQPHLGLFWTISGSYGPVQVSSGCDATR